MRRFLRRAAVCVALFCSNPRALFYAAGHPDSPEGRELRRLLRGDPPQKNL